MSKLENTDYYDRLEVSPRARATVVDAAYRALMKEYHPDVSGKTVSAATQLNVAHDVLSDPTKRAAYDRQREHPVGKVIGNYRLLERIAEGGFGTTYKAEHILAEEPVCIKHCSRISPEDDAVLIAEAKSVWNLRHHALPAMKDLLRLEDRSLALVMSYIPGFTLEEIVSKTGKLDPEHIAWITERSLNALKYLHYNGVVHGDIKPQNIIIQPEDHSVTLIDFGLSLVKPTRYTDSKGFTPYFAPPEQMEGKPILPESDFYSLGMTMIYGLSGKLEHVEHKQVPRNVPDALCQFIHDITKTQILERPKWEEIDLCDRIQAVRKQAFGRSRSDMKPISGLS